jgi:hypothetical protein
MAMTFADFVQIELPKRPFAETDGAPGQVLVRSSRPERPRELVWANMPEVDLGLQLEAGEDLEAGTPVMVVGNKLYAADQMTNPHILGIIVTSVSTGFLATISTGGKLNLSGLVAGVPYYVGAGVITNVPPTSGYLIRVGMAATASVLLVEIEAPILLT